MGKRIWITGTNRGLGLYLKGSLGWGHEVIGVDRDVVDLGLAPISVSKQFSKFYFRHPEGPDIFIHNAGLLELDWAENTDLEVYERIMRVNCLSRFAINRSLLNKSLDRNLRIIHIGSLAAKVPMQTSNAYCASKAADEMSVRALGREISGRSPNTLLFGVNPGTIGESSMEAKVLTSLVEVRGMTPAAAVIYNMQSPRKSPSTMADVLSVIRYLAFDAPPHMSGSFIDMPGGIL